MAFQRRILHHGPDPEATPQLLSMTAIRSCWFELHRQGGCGAGEIVLSDDFDLRGHIELGDWISFEAKAGDRWYLGRVEERQAEVPARVRYRLAGMSIELNEIFPGGFGSAVDGRNPHRYAATDLFSLDPDRHRETYDFATSAEEVVRLLLTQYLPASGHIHYVPSLIETPARPAAVTSLKVRGEESVRALINDLALRAQGAAWGVNAHGEFFFLRPRDEVLTTFQQQRDLTSLAETRDFEFLFNRLLLTGDYVYDQQEETGDVARRVYRWRGNYVEPKSRSQFGDRRIRIWLPWIRTQNDSLAFSREFFRTYSRPSSRYLIETTGQSTLPIPWLGRVRLETHTGVELATSRVETIRVLFDYAPRFRLELGPEDPRTLWPEPPQDERWELPNQVVSAGGDVSLPSASSIGGGGGNGPGGGSGGGGESGWGSGSLSSEGSASASAASSLGSEVGSQSPSEGSSLISSSPRPSGSSGPKGTGSGGGGQNGSGYAGSGSVGSGTGSSGDSGSEAMSHSDGGTASAGGQSESLPVGSGSEGGVSSFGSVLSGDASSFMASSGPGSSGGGSSPFGSSGANDSGSNPSSGGSAPGEPSGSGLSSEVGSSGGGNGGSLSGAGSSVGDFSGSGGASEPGGSSVGVGSSGGRGGSLSGAGSSAGDFSGSGGASAPGGSSAGVGSSGGGGGSLSGAGSSAGDFSGSGGASAPGGSSAGVGSSGGGENGGSSAGEGSSVEGGFNSSDWPFYSSAFF